VSATHHSSPASGSIGFAHAAIRHELSHGAEGRPSRYSAGCASHSLDVARYSTGRISVHVSGATGTVTSVIGVGHAHGPHSVIPESYARSKGNRMSQHTGQSAPAAPRDLKSKLVSIAVLATFTIAALVAAHDEHGFERIVLAIGSVPLAIATMTQAIETAGSLRRKGAGR
jgi:hypothetical protein